MVTMSFPTREPGERSSRRMTARLIGVIAIFLFSFCSFLFFLFFVNPEYLDFSGFLAFYISLLGWVWSLVLLLGYYLDRKVQLPDAVIEGFVRRCGLFAGFIVANIFMLQAGWWSVYAMIGLATVIVAFEYWVRKR